MKFEKPFLGGPEQVRRSYGKNGETRNGGVVDPGRMVPESPKPSATREPVLTGSESRGDSRELTERLMAKADELDKLIAQLQHHASPHCSNPSGKERTGHSPPGCEFSSQVNRNERSRGEFYKRYMEKREAKVREEWRTRRAEKEMKSRVLQDCFDQISADLRAKLLGPAEGYRSISGARRRVEKLQSFNARSISFRMQQVQCISVNSEGEEEAYELMELKLYRNNGFTDRDSSCSAPRSPAIPVPKPSLKRSPDFASARRSGQTVSPISHSLPSKSNLQQQKSGRPDGVGETRTHSQGVNFPRNRSNREELLPRKEEKLGRSQSMRRTFASKSDNASFRKTWPRRTCRKGRDFDDSVGIVRQVHKFYGSKDVNLS